MYVEYCTVCKCIKLVFEILPCLFNKRCVIFNAVYGKIGICAVRFAVVVGFADIAVVAAKFSALGYGSHYHRSRIKVRRTCKVGRNYACEAPFAAEYVFEHTYVVRSIGCANAVERYHYGKSAAFVEAAFEAAQD